MTNCTALQTLALHNFKENFFFFFCCFETDWIYPPAPSLRGVPISLFFLSLIIRAKMVQHHATLRC